MILTIVYIKFLWKSLTASYQPSIAKETEQSYLPLSSSNKEIDTN